MSDKTDLEKFTESMVRVARQLNVGVSMLQLMVLQLDGRIEVKDETMKLYLGALDGGVRKVNAFKKHLIDGYFGGS